jgi:hypothetical protein
VYLLRMLCEQKVDAQFAVILLGIGFALQALAAIGINVAGSVIVFILLVPLAGAVVAYATKRDALTKGKMRGALRASKGMDIEEQIAKAFGGLG